MSDENNKASKSIQVVKVQDDPLSDLGNMDGEWSQLIRSSEGFLIAGAGSSGDGSSGGCSGSGGSSGDSGGAK